MGNDYNENFIQDVKKLVPNTLSRYPILLKSKKDKDFIAGVFNLTKINDHHPYVIFNKDFCDKYNNKPTEDGLSDSAKNLFQMLYLHELMHIHIAPGVKEKNIAVEALIDSILKHYSDKHIKNILSDIVINATLSKYGYFDNKLIREFTNTFANKDFKKVDINKHLSLSLILYLCLTDINTLGRNQLVKKLKQEIIQKYLFVWKKMRLIKKVAFSAKDNPQDRISTYIKIAKISKEIADYIEIYQVKQEMMQLQGQNLMQGNMNNEQAKDQQSQQSSIAGNNKSKDDLNNDNEDDEQEDNLGKGNNNKDKSDDENNQREKDNLGNNGEEEDKDVDIKAGDDLEDDDEKKELENIEAEDNENIQGDENIFDEENVSSNIPDVDLEDLKNAKTIIKNTTGLLDEEKQEAVKKAGERFKEILENKMKKKCVGQGLGEFNKTLIKKIIEYYMNNTEDYRELTIGNLSESNSFMLPLYNVKSDEVSYVMPSDTMQIKSMIKNSLQLYGKPTTIFSLPPYQQPYKIENHLSGYDISNNISDVCFVIDTSASIDDDTVIKTIKMISTMFEKIAPNKVRIILFSYGPYYDITFDYSKKKYNFLDIVSTIIQSGILRGGTHLSSSLKKISDDNDGNTFLGNIILITDAELLAQDALDSIAMIDKLYKKGYTIFSAIVNNNVSNKALEKALKEKSVAYQSGTDIIKVIHDICNSVKENYNLILSDIYNRTKLSI